MTLALAFALALHLPHIVLGAAAQQSAPSHAPLRPQVKRVRFVAIGDYGLAGPGEAAVAALVASLAPDLVVTLGDNNYEDGASSTIDTNIGQYYSAFIHPYTGAFGPGGTVNRFFPSLGNHDWNTPGAAPYLAYFALPGNERYYDFVHGPVHFYALDSDGREPDGISPSSVQGEWLQARLAASTSPFDVVYFHHAPYSSSSHGSTSHVQWPFREWGADLVLSGHDHDYERVLRNGFPYVVNGLGGAAQYPTTEPHVGGSQVRFNSDHGALLVEASERALALRFVTVGGIVVDECTLRVGGTTTNDVDVLPAGSTWKYEDDGSNQGTAWRAVLFDDSSWASGPAELGYGDGDEATVVSFGPNPNDRHETTYFRHTFAVADPSLFRAFRLELLRDDGAVVYLNGAEVYRTNLTSGTVLHDTLAATAATNANEDAFWTMDLAPGAIVAGANTLAVEVHQSATDSSDVSFDLRVVGTPLGTVLSARGATWKYLDDGSDQGTAWRAPSFDDASWASGPAELGYGDGDEATVVSFGPNPSDRHETTYFRKSFTVAPNAHYEGLWLELLRDDGAAVYINGVEVLRTNVPAAALGHTTLAGFNVSGDAETARIGTLVDPAVLVTGTNVIAVELHQVGVTSTDLSFDLELVGL
ncbi:MAG: metallophosphoesterase [Planctomycetota bacterium]